MVIYKQRRKVIYMTTTSDKQLKENIQKNLIFYRKKMKKTQKDLAAALGVSAAAISSWECGNNSPDIDTFRDVTEAVYTHRAYSDYEEAVALICYDGEDIEFESIDAEWD